VAAPTPGRTSTHFRSGAMTSSKDADLAAAIAESPF
jgi:hypothetical protein